MKFFINTDGASRGNPGPAAYGYIIKDSKGEILHQEGGVLGKTTNNVAEYTAVVKALEYIAQYYGKQSPHAVTVMLDSLLVAQQLSGVYKIKSEGLRPLFIQARELMNELGEVTFTHIPRAQNYIADRLANMALDQQK